MYPYLVHTGHLYLPTFGVLAAVGLMMALGLSERTARILDLDPERLWDAGIFAILAAFVLSRALLVAANWHTFLSFPLLLLIVPSLTVWGLLLAGLLTLVYLYWKHLPLLRSLDAWAPCATLVWAALALGHFAEGSDPGMPTRSPFGVEVPGQPSPLHPVALYAALFAVILTVWLYRRLAKQRNPGETTAAALLSAGLVQFLLSFLREPGLQAFAGLDALEWVALAMIFTGGLLLARPPNWAPHASFVRRRGANPNPSIRVE